MSVLVVHGTANGCARCGEQFGTLEQFDRHQDVDYGRNPVIVCRTPVSMGLVRDVHGVWQTPAGLAARQASRQNAGSRLRSRTQSARGLPGDHT
jgi:hypothetical protein